MGFGRKSKDTSEQKKRKKGKKVAGTEMVPRQTIYLLLLKDSPLKGLVPCVSQSSGELTHCEHVGEDVSVHAGAATSAWQKQQSKCG